MRSPNPCCRAVWVWTKGAGRLAYVAGGKPALFEVLLVVVLGGVELGGGDDLGDDGPPETVAAFEPRLGVERSGLLLGGEVEDGRPVLGANVGALAVEGGGVVILPENL